MIKAIKNQSVKIGIGDRIAILIAVWALIRQAKRVRFRDAFQIKTTDKAL